MATQSDDENKTETGGAAVTSGGTRVNWDTSKLQSNYANVCSVTSTREEVVLNFGINEAWERGQAEMQIQLSNRIILSPFAAKRMADGLNKLLTEYENRYGKLPE
jgi:hypothetical protein